MIGKVPAEAVGCHSDSKGVRSVSKKMFLMYGRRSSKRLEKTEARSVAFVVSRFPACYVVVDVSV